MKPSRVCGRPSRRAPRRRGSATARSARIRPSGVRRSSPSANSVTYAEVTSSIAAFVEQLANRVAALASEELERLFLGRDERELDSLDLVGAEMGRGHQRQLVERQRPDRAPGHGEGDPAHVAGDDLLEQGAELLRVRGAAEGQRARNSLGRNGADGDEQGVVGNLADGGLRLVARRIDALRARRA